MDYPQAEWRLVNSGFQDGPSNMAWDEAIMEAVALGQSPPALRFYSWEPACLSLGFRQGWRLIDQEYCQEVGWDIVRRPTGGRAILHIDELTYSVCAPIGEPRVEGRVLESYQRLSEALLSGLRIMGLEPAKADPDPTQNGVDGPACFDGPSNYEITVQGRKLVGSAQVRKKGVVLQHGTLPLYGDVSRICHGLYFESEDRRQALIEALRRQAITLEEALSRRISYDEAVSAMRAGFEQALNLTLKTSGLSESERERAAELRAEKYANDSWTRRL
jgi:lipoate-protein ligase A